jgi:octaprenyl-diphosphate synthase
MPKIVNIPHAKKGSFKRDPLQPAFDLVAREMKRVDEGFKHHIDTDVLYIRKVCEYIIRSGGKRYRPMLLLLSAKLLGYEGDRHIPLAAMIEFIHTATLLHDDVVDSAELRRGKPSVNAVWGNSTSVLVGDYLLAKSFNIAVNDGDMRILEVLSKTTSRMAEGEVLQLLRHGDIEMTEADYLQVVSDKTAVLISAACTIAAIVGKASQEGEEALGSFGMDLGIAFQLTDDCLDYVSSSDDLGKAVGNDLREGKVTMPLIEAYRNATVSERDDMRRAVEAKELSPDALRRVVEVINKYRGIEYAKVRARSHVERAKERLGLFPDSKEKSALVSVADAVVDRAS